MFRKIRWWFYIIWLSLPWMSGLCLGNIVFYQERRWILSQGVNKPVWTLARRVQNGEWVSIQAHESSFRKLWTPRNVIHSFCSGYRFYRGYWYDIWVMNNHRSGAP